MLSRVIYRAVLYVAMLPDERKTVGEGLVERIAYLASPCGALSADVQLMAV